ncbi:MAG: putative molybdenum carrier protein, partial [Nitrospirota bacterium]
VSDAGELTWQPARREAPIDQLDGPGYARPWKDGEDWMVEKIVSGGQTGVDRAALDVALQLGIPCGGWCPKGRKAEGGRVPKRYPLEETPSDDYAQRTEWNVRDSDGTLVLTVGPPTEGTAFTVQVAERLRKPSLVLDLDDHPSAATVKTWAITHQIRVLNVAGPRESKCPGIYDRAATFLRQLLSAH